MESIELDDRVQSVRTGVSNGIEVVSYGADVVTEKVTERAFIATNRAKQKVVLTHERVSESVQSVRENASGLLTETYETVAESASSLQEKGHASLQALRETEVLQKVRDSASLAAGAVSSAASSTLGGVSALAVSPTKWLKFIGIFGVGVASIISSLTSLPLIIVMPQRFAMLFTFGSVAILGSFVVFSGPKALAMQMIKKDKLPFSFAYIVGLVGTFLATLYFRSYIATIVFALIQAVALLYFVVSYLPGGKATVSACFRASGRSVRRLIFL